MKGRDHFNHQTWRNGRNAVRYVPRNRVEDLRAAIDGYARFMILAEQYADEIIRLTRLQQNSQTQKTSSEKSCRASSPQGKCPKQADLDAFALHPKLG